MRLNLIKLKPVMFEAEQRMSVMMVNKKAIKHCNGNPSMKSIKILYIQVIGRDMRGEALGIVNH